MTETWQRNIYKTTPVTRCYRDQLQVRFHFSHTFRFLYMNRDNRVLRSWPWILRSPPAELIHHKRSEALRGCWRQWREDLNNSLQPSVDLQTAFLPDVNEGASDKLLSLVLCKTPAGKLWKLLPDEGRRVHFILRRYLHHFFTSCCSAEQIFPLPERLFRTFIMLRMWGKKILFKSNKKNVTFHFYASWPNVAFLTGDNWSTKDFKIFP